MRRFIALGILALLGGSACQRGVHSSALPVSTSRPAPVGPTADGAPPSNEELGQAIGLQRVAVLGASMSGGFAAESIADRLASGLSRDHAIGDFANVMLFKDPLGGLRQQVEAAQAFEPTDTFALDALFWLAYGTRSQSRRLRRLQEGLALLETVPGRIYLGDIPLVASAKRWIISEIPSPDELGHINEQLQQWADARANIELIPISVWAEPLATGTPITTEPGAAPRDAAEFLFIDGLHPNDDGMDYLLSRTWKQLTETYPATQLNPF